jgi:exopolysaccharide biosynthesis polyprenyl glycosylphosphotransferase
MRPIPIRSTPRQAPPPPGRAVTLQRSSRPAGAVLRVLDLAALALALPIAYGVWRSFPAASWGAPPLEAFWAGLALELVLWSGSAWAHGIYEVESQRPAQGLWRLLRCFALAAMSVAVLAFALQFQGLTRLFAALYFATAFALLVATRVALHLALMAGRRRGYHLRRFVVVGSGDMARQVVEAVARHPEWGLALVGHVAESRALARGENLGSLEDFARILERHVVDEAIFALPHERMSVHGGAVQRAILLCEEQGVAVRISLDVLRYSGTSHMQVADLDGMPMLCFTRTPTDALALLAKRAFDLAVAGFVLALMSPVLLVVAVAIKLDSPGPIFFRQRRVGLNGRDFTMMKFRSMCADAEQGLAALRARNEMSGPVFKMKADPRVTRVGRLLRKTSLDEFPQFLNVLRGEMSVVGPRPPIRAEVDQYQRWQRRRLSVRPGITCTWQISGRNEIDFEQWMRLDLEYIDRWSLWQDLRICLETVPAVLAARGAR